MYAALSDWNLLQSKLQNLMSLDHFKRVIWQMEIDSTTCNCILSVCVVISCDETDVLLSILARTSQRVSSG